MAVLNLSKEKKLMGLVKFYGVYGTSSTINYVSEVGIFDLVRFI